MSSAAALLLIGVVLVIILSLANWKWIARKPTAQRNLGSRGGATPAALDAPADPATPAAPAAPAAPPPLLPRPVLEFHLDRRQSINMHLQDLSKNLAEKELSISLSRNRLQETQQALDQLSPRADDGVRRQYAVMMDVLRDDLRSNEEDCRRLQDRIEWVARRRAEVEEEMDRSQQLYSDATSNLLSSLAQLQRERVKRGLAPAAPAPAASPARVRRKDAAPVPNIAW